MYKESPLEKFAFKKINEDTVVDIATTKNLTAKEVQEMISSKIFIPELKEKFMEILSELLLHKYIIMEFKGEKRFIRKLGNGKERRFKRTHLCTFWLSY